MFKTIMLMTMIMMTAIPALARKHSRNVEAEIRRVNSQEVEGLLGNDVRALDELWSNDLVVTNPLNKFVRKHDVLTLIKSGFLAFTTYERRIDYIRLYGNVAVVAGSETVVWAGKMPNAGKTSLLRFTGIWRRVKGRWQEVARHANVVR